MDDSNAVDLPTPDTTGHDTPTRRGAAALRGALAGVIALGVALGTAELVRAFERSLSSPVIDVGARFIDATPRWLKDVAIDVFGTNDKTALLVGIAITMALYAVVVGIVAVRHRRIGVIGVGLFAAIGIAAASAGTGPWWAGLPSLVGGVAGAFALLYLSRQAARAAGVEPSPVVEESTTEESSMVERSSVASGTGDGRRASIAELTEADRAAADRGIARRAFLRGGAALAGAAVVAAGTGRWLAERFDAAATRAGIVLPKPATPLPAVPAGVEMDVPGLTPFFTKNEDFYRIDTALVAPEVDVESWSLRITGMVDAEIELTYDELLALDLVESDITLSCVSNEIGGSLAGNARWLGIPLAELLASAGVQRGADQVVGRSVDGFTAGFPVEFGVEPSRGALVAVAMNGEPLPVVNGFPARLVVPGLYGYVSATKWLTEIELTTFDSFDAYWAEREWSVEGPIKTFSRIDTPGPLQRISAGTHPIAGVAWAQTRGIERVEVRIDGGEWMDAELADEYGDVTWRQWMLAHDFTETGQHSIECRATDGTGEVQTEERVDPFPAGASGWHSLVVLVD